MDHPYYTVTVTSLTRGWTYSAVEGQEPDPDDRVVLTIPLAYTFGFTDDQLPGQLVTSTAEVNLVARTGNDLPEVQTNDLIAITVCIGTTGPYVIAPPPMRAATPQVALTPGQTYAAAMSLTLADLSVDWTALAVGATYSGTAARDLWRERLAEVANRTGVTVGCPTWWADAEQPAGTFKLHPVTSRGSASGFTKNAQETLTELINSHQPDGLTHTFATVYGPHPAGYRRVGPDVWDSFAGAIPEPDTAVKIEAVPTSRRSPATLGLPFALEVSGGRLGLVLRPPRPGPGLGAVGLDSAWCVVPATARRAREHAVNTLVLKGQTVSRELKDGRDGSLGPSDYTYTFADDTLTLSVGTPPVVREVPTELYLGAIGFSDPVYGPAALEPAQVATAMLSGSELATMWAYDEFQVKASDMPQDLAEQILPVLAPRLPGEPDGDGRLARHATVRGLSADVQLGEQLPNGFVVSGSLQITQRRKGVGDLALFLTLAPGEPEWTDRRPRAVTVLELSDEYGSLTFADLEPITFTDLAYTEAS